MELDYADREWTAPDGLLLHYRDYPGPADRPVLLCLPGLTRNARDFEPLAARLAGDWRIVSPDLRGRGKSGYADDPASYTPGQYLRDLLALAEQAELSRVVAIGTSLGGILTMLLAQARPALLAGALLNDIGPELDPAGLDRIRGYVGQGRSCPTWMHAARALAEEQGAAYPGFELDDWLAMAKRVMAVGSGGRIVFDYDMKIAEAFARPENARGGDLWPSFRALAATGPLVVLRGQRSDLLSPAVADAMRAAAPGTDLVEVAGVGHAPVLDEPEARAAIDRLLDAVR